MVMLSHLVMSDVYKHYLNREQTHKTLLQLFNKKDVPNYLKLAVGISDAGGNYSAAEHQLGDRVLGDNQETSIFSMVEDLVNCSSSVEIPSVIYHHNLKYLKISVGSEMAMMLRPNNFWVANVRTVWAHLLIKHGDNYKLANEELELYKDGDRTSEMDYRIWSEIYSLLEVSLVRLHDIGRDEARKQGSQSGILKYLWADAIASMLYDSAVKRGYIPHHKILK
jgi:hypothetical protein